MWRTASFASRPAARGRANVQQKKLTLLLLWRRREDAEVRPIGLFQPIPRMGHARCVLRILAGKAPPTCNEMCSFVVF
jgi:hypothetical protein